MNESIRVADALDRGEIPWRLTAGFPLNVVSRKPLGGTTPILLQIAATDALGCSSPWWGTTEDWAAKNSKVPYGIGVRVPGSASPLHNWEFTDRAYVPPPLTAENPDAVFEAIIKGLGVSMEFVVRPECKYIGAQDTIRIPYRWMFEIGPGGTSGWFDALAHELFHASEPRLRLGWDGHPDVAELRAEIGSGYLCGLLGVAPLPRYLARHHDAHVGRWVRLMKADPQLFLKVCGDVTETVSYLLRFAGKEVTWHDAGLEKPCCGVSVR